MRVETEEKLDFADVLIRPKRSTLNSRKEVNLMRTFRFLHSPIVWTGIPIVAANMDTTGTFEMAKVLSQFKIITNLHKFYSVEELEEFFRNFNEPNYIGYTTGIRENDFEKLRKVLARGLGKKFNFICLDAANAYLEPFMEKLEELRRMCPDHIIIAGNVATNEMTEELLLRGADIVKIGIGPGSACTTRRMAGVGVPQLSATIECSDAAHGISNKDGNCGRIMTDGGMVYPSDVSKALCAGADFAYSGKLFSGFEESGGEIIIKNGKKYKQYYGMSSSTAMHKHYGKVDEHRASEGRYTEVPYRGNVADAILELLGSLRSTGTYIGARSIKEFSKRCTFLKVRRQLNESLHEFDQTLQH